MNLVDPEILSQLTSDAPAGFDDLFAQLRHPKKHELKLLLVYFDKVLTFMLNRETNGLRCTHIHFPKITAAPKDALLEFLVTRCFRQSLDKDQEQDSYAEHRLRALSTKLTHSQAPPEASGKNGGNMAYRRWMDEKERWRAEIAFLRSVAPFQKALHPDTIINLLANDLRNFETSLHTMSVEDLGARRGYCLLNPDLPIDKLMQQLQMHGRDKGITQILLFDCEGRKNFNEYSKHILDILIQRRYPLHDLVIISFDKRPFRIQQLINKLDLTSKRFFLSSQERLGFKDSYAIPEAELSQLTKAETQYPPVWWVGHPSELFADYCDLVVDLALGGLRSPTVLNTYAAALNQEMAQLICNDLFDPGPGQGLFPDELRAGVRQLDPQHRDQLKASIKNLLDLVAFEWEAIKTQLRARETPKKLGVVIPGRLIKNTAFQRHWQQLLPANKLNFYTWKEMRDVQFKEELILVLAYRDAGRYPFPLYPSLLEGVTAHTTKFSPILLSMFFRQRYARCEYDYLLAMWRALNNDFRQRHLDWKTVEARLQAIRPEYQEGLMEEEEDDDDELDDADESIRVEYLDQGRATFYPSRPIIIRDQEGGRLSVCRADELPEEADQWVIQPLDELYEDLNIFQITREQEQELQFIKAGYNVHDPRQALWKVLLIRKLETGENEKSLYHQLGVLFKDKDFIGFDYFRDHWLDAGSPLLVPRKRRHFKELCAYLGLSRAYRSLELKKSISLKANSRQSHIRMNSLLGQMIEEGLFEPSFPWQERSLEHFMDVHQLEDKGFSEENLSSEMNTLVQLLKEKLELKKVQKIEKT